MVGWQIAGLTLLLLLAVELACRGVQRLSEAPSPREQAWADRLEAQHDPPGMRSLFEQQELSRLQWEEFVYWRRLPLASPALNIDGEGLRRTTNPAAASASSAASAIRVFTFGGSTLWGWNSRDDHTIASCLSRQAAAAGFPVQVTNYAQTAYVSTQEAITLTRLLGAGRRPDIVVFLDGVNDLHTTIIDGEAGDAFWKRERQSWEAKVLNGVTAKVGLEAIVNNSATFQMLSSLGARRGADGDSDGDPKVPDAKVASLAGEIARYYAANAAAVEGLAHAYGFQPFLYWQPTIVKKKKLAPLEAKLVPVDGADFTRNRALVLETSRRVDEAMRARPAFRNIDGLFADTEELVFTDGQHYAESANETIARVVLADLRPVLERLRGERGARP